MATVLLQAAGGALGGMIGGPFGAVAGRALGALGGYAVDSRLLNGRTQREGARLTANRVMEADEGAGVARVYGTARVSGQVIWTTRFEEVQSTERQGGKGGGAGAATTSYSYFGNVAVGLCEGPIACVRRVWADGEELDLAATQWRLHRGDETQAPDPLIEAKQGRGNAPAYRGLAYLVFERLPLERWGNRIPQISCEVVRVVGSLEGNIRAITIIPGATEHGLDPIVVRERIGEGEDRFLNRNMLHGASDWSASLDELTALCPKLERAALVCAWFADDLRAGRATCRPGVETRVRDETEVWRSGSVGREGARLVSQVDGGPAYGGTPSDAGVLRAIAALRAKGLKVTFYPFLLMDVPPDNRLPDPYGDGFQAAFPWRGRMTLDRAETETGTADRTQRARQDIERFVGSARAEHFRVTGGEVRYEGPVEWSYRRMILHQAHLARVAGGVDAFVIGSEMRGLTRLRDGDGRFPFVEALIALAREVKALLPAATVTYAADWSEYFGYQPADGSGDVFFNLDPLWAEPSIGAVGIDNYLPLTDHRDGDAGSPYDVGELTAGITGGEYAEWFYADGGARERGERSPITDGLGKPWVFRAKDLRSWWENAHHERRGGRELEGATDWVPRSKPIWFTELGCPAVDKGANQPNVFVDPKSAESAFPHFSDGGRDDLQQRRFLEAHQAHWDPDVAGFEEGRNPVSPIYGGRMVPADAIHLWTWDARPFPTFPERASLWRDGDNWRRGHWLSGRLGRGPLDGLLAALLRDHGIEDFDLSEVEELIGSFVVSEPGSARGEIEDLLRLCGIEVRAEAGRLCFRSARRGAPVERPLALVDGDDEARFEIRRSQADELPGEIVVGFADADRTYRPAVAEADFGLREGPNQASIELTVVMTEGEARRLARGLLVREGEERETARFAVSPTEIWLVPGDRIRLDEVPGTWQIERIEDGAARRIEARRLPPGGRAGGTDEGKTGVEPVGPVFASRPVVHTLDLPKLEAGDERGGERIAISARPWVPYAVLGSTSRSGHSPVLEVRSRAVVGRLVEALESGRETILDRTNVIVVDLSSGSLSSLDPARVRAGENRAAVHTASGGWEVLSFDVAEEVAPSRWRLSNLTRGIGGTGEEAQAGSAAGNAFVLLDRGVGRVEAGSNEDWLVVPAGHTLDDPAAVRWEGAAGLRWKRPLSPVHLRGRYGTDGLELSWIRRTRSIDDAWDGVDVPMDEEREAYEVYLTFPNGRHVIERVSEPKLRLTSAELAAQMGELSASISVEVAQVSQSVGAGARTRLALHST
ncbi:glycoside hydrolase/phage tail family protein [Aureimonas sp. ME7]|uniref:baseplate multidomain protein megatron n=1 Tax=Aureimonas sp. ME7 TaxID=2744252 RepID=UPI0015F40057|nr:glycoside hydrolase/phage tail family protein [Aureimonas sp. ME7]